jgi:hypothetical protein
MLHLGYVAELKDDFARLSPSTRYEYFRIGVEADKWARARASKGEVKEYRHETKKNYPKRRWNKALVAEYLGRGLDTEGYLVEHLNQALCRVQLNQRHQEWKSTRDTIVLPFSPRTAID